MRVEVPEFPLFKSRVLDLTPVKTEPDAPEDPELGPTVPAPDTGSP
jgi:hypothetical protein